MFKSSLGVEKEDKVRLDRVQKVLRVGEEEEEWASKDRQPPPPSSSSILPHPAGGGGSPIKTRFFSIGSVLLMSAQGPFSFLVDGQLLFSPPKQIDVYTLNVVPPGRVGRSCVPLTLGCMMMWIYRWDVCSAQKPLGEVPIAQCATLLLSSTS